ncbi:MAG: DUF1844 domain-containing protein [Deltaproteobacteria bacterium]|nr:DUF1844 domain-containing protein [Deltaproteobacteria bacterium]
MSDSNKDEGTERAADRIEFSEFVLSIATNAVAHLQGESGGDDDRVPAAADVALASQHIDILAMLKDKTTGNLEPAEIELLDSLLYDLRMRYVEVLRNQKP